MSTVAESMKTVTHLAILTNNWSDAKLNSIMESDLSDKQNLQTLNKQLQSYLELVKNLESLNQKLIKDVEEAKEAAKPKEMDKSELENKLKITRDQLELGSNAVVSIQTSIEEAESICNYFVSRIKFLSEEINLNKKKISALEANLKDMIGQKIILDNSTKTFNADLSTEKSKQLKLEKDIADARSKLKDARLKNKNVEFTMNTTLDQLEFLKVVLAEERKLFADTLGGLGSSSLDLTNYYKTELVAAVQQIRSDFHDLSERQFADLKANKEKELEFLKSELEQQKIENEEKIKLSMQLNESSLLEASGMQSQKDAMDKQLLDLNNSNQNLANKLAELERKISEKGMSQSYSLQLLQQQIDSMKVSNKSITTDINYWHSVSRSKLLREIETYKSILNSKMALSANFAQQTSSSSSSASSSSSSSASSSTTITTTTKTITSSNTIQ